MPGFVEIDLVGHDGGNAGGEFAQTLDVTDICTGWTEMQAVKNKAQVWVFEALTDIRDRLPFKLLGIDSDNGSEFINDHLYKYCIEEKITRSIIRVRLELGKIVNVNLVWSIFLANVSLLFKAISAMQSMRTVGD